MQFLGSTRIKENIWYVLLNFLNICSYSEEWNPTCFSNIYCHGRLLHTIQMANISDDSKTFVDMKMIYSPTETMERFNSFMKKHGDIPSRMDIQEFVNTTFDSAGQELQDWKPDDWIPNPKFVNKIKDEELKYFALHLNSIWKILGKKIKDEVANNKDHYSIIWVPNPFIIPGGRFREFYYWDTYWIVQGLLHSEMYSTTKGVLENLLYIVKHYGLVPNGGRIYYLGRSQPPLLIPMVKLYFDFTHDLKFISRNIRLLEKEFYYWMTNHTKTITKDDVKYTLALYGDRSNGPRPESYLEDVETGKAFETENEKEAFYSEIKAAAESGLDFSSRWFILNTINKGNLTNLKTRSIVPVDLNAILYWNANLLSEFNLLLNRTDRAKKFRKVAVKWKKAVTAVLWNEKVGSWLDYDIINKIQRNFFYPTNISPLWTGCYDTSNTKTIVRKIINYLKRENFLYVGGVPTSHEDTGEQWDFPNAWPPLQHIMIVGLSNTGNKHALKLAFQIAEAWVHSNYLGYNETKDMYEKYDATVPGYHGGGGEYVVQKGFGWTNGVVLDLLYRYANTLSRPPTNSSIPSTLATVPPKSKDTSSNSNSIIGMTRSLITVLVSLTVSVYGNNIFIWIELKIKYI